MAPNQPYDEAQLGICILIIALWEIIANQAQPHPVIGLVKIKETSRNRRWRRKVQKEGRLSRPLARITRWAGDHPPLSWLLNGVARQPKYNAVFELCYGTENLFNYGRGYQIPASIPSQHHRAIVMFRACDSSNWVMKPLLANLLQALDPEFDVQWLCVVPIPRIQYQRPGCEPPIGHSVLLITAPSGTKTVLDLTGEQFGFDPQDRICSLDHYLRNYVADTSEWSSAHYTCNIGTLEQYFDNSMGGIIFWQRAHNLVEGLFGKWRSEVDSGRLEDTDSNREAYMNRAVDQEMAWFRKASS